MIDKQLYHCFVLLEFLYSNLELILKLERNVPTPEIFSSHGKTHSLNIVFLGRCLCIYNTL